MKDLKVVFMGTTDFAVTVLESLIDTTDVVLVVSKKDALVGRKRVLTPSPVKKAAMDKNIEVYTPGDLKNEYEYIINKKPDIIITCAYGEVVPKQVLDYPTYGCINVHASLLPSYRGASPINAAIRDGLDKTGVTIMYMDEGVDTGNIIQARELEITDTDTYGSLSEKLSVLGAETLIQTLPSIISGENFDIPQNEEFASYVSVLKREDEQIDFKKTRKEIYNFVRSLNPAPLANMIILGDEWKIVETKVGGDKKGEIGCVSSINKDSFGIFCGDGEILVTKVKPAGKKEMSVKDLFNGMDANKLNGVRVGVVNEEETRK